MEWFNRLDSTTRALILTVVNALIVVLWTTLGQTTPAPIIVPPSVVNVQPAAGAPMVAVPAADARPVK